MRKDGTDIDKGFAMEGQLSPFGMVFSPEVGMPNTGHIVHKEPRRPDASKGLDNSNPLYSAYRNYFVNNIRTIIHSISASKKMATIKMSWTLFYLLGGSVYLFTTILAAVSMDETKQWTLFFFSVIFALTAAYRQFWIARMKREDWREKKIANEERELELRINHEKHEQWKVANKIS